MVGGTEQNIYPDAFAIAASPLMLLLAMDDDVKTRRSTFHDPSLRLIGQAQRSDDSATVESGDRRNVIAPSLHRLTDEIDELEHLA